MIYFVHLVVMKTTVRSVLLRIFETIPKKLEKRLEKREIREKWKSRLQPFRDRMEYGEDSDLVWFLCLMAYQLFLGYLMPKPFS